MTRSRWLRRRRAGGRRTLQARLERRELQEGFAFGSSGRQGFAECRPGEGVTRTPAPGQRERTTSLIEIPVDRCQQAGDERPPHAGRAQACVGAPPAAIPVPLRRVISTGHGPVFADGPPPSQSTRRIGPRASWDWEKAGSSAREAEPPNTRRCLAREHPIEHRMKLFGRQRLREDVRRLPQRIASDGSLSTVALAVMAAPDDRGFRECAAKRSQANRRCSFDAGVASNTDVESSFSAQKAERVSHRLPRPHVEAMCG